MTGIALDTIHNPVSMFEKARDGSCLARVELLEQMARKDILFLGLILILMQVADGLLTAYGVSLFGTAAEGNPLVRSLMDIFGYLPALFIVKACAVMIIFYLCKLSSEVIWLTGAMRGMIGLYLLAAIIPWTAILVRHLV